MPAVFTCEAMASHIANCVAPVLPGLAFGRAEAPSGRSKSCLQSGTRHGLFSHRILVCFFYIHQCGGALAWILTTNRLPPLFFARWAGLMAVRQQMLREFSAKKLQQTFISHKRRQQARERRRLLLAERKAAAIVSGTSFRTEMLPHVLTCSAL